jgi:hypothetical protein
MPQWHQKIIVAVIVVVPIWLPYFSYASFADTFSQKAAFAGFAVGSMIDQTVQHSMSLQSSILKTKTLTANLLDIPSTLWNNTIYYLWHVKEGAKSVITGEAFSSP